MNWHWLAVAIVAPTVAGFLVAFPFWLLRQETMGSIVGSGVILFGAMLSMMREYAAMQIMRAACLKAGTPFHPVPDEFTRYFVYTSIGFAEVFALFIVSLSIEERLRARERSPEWR